MRNRSVALSWLVTVVIAALILLGATGSVGYAQEGATSEPPAAGEAARPVVRFYLFYGETCPHCHRIMDEYLPQVYEKYGDQVESEYIDVWSDTEAYLTLLALEMKLGVPEELRGSVPALVIGDKVLVGSLEIPEKLETYIDEYLAQGGVDYPSLEDLPEVVLPTPEPAVQLLVFFDPEHEDFPTLNDLIVELGQEHGAIEAYAADISVEENAEKLAELNAALGIEPPAPGTPEVLIGRQILVGIDEISDELPTLVETYLGQGGVELPVWEELVGGSAVATPTPGTPTPDEPTPASALTAPAEKAIHMAYFEQAGCQECARTSYDLRVAQSQYPQLVVDSFSMEEAENKALNEWLSEKYDVPEEQRLSTPMLFVGEDVLIGSEATLNNILAAVGKYAQTGAEPTWEDFDAAQAEQSLIDRFRSFGLLTVLGAGLIDGLNPCAFATLVFFISYLAFTGRRGRDILFVGIAFALGVFLTYLLVGVGLLKIVQSLSFFTALGRWVYLLTAALCVVLAAFTFRDYLKARQGQVTDMALSLPLGLRRRIHKVIREGSQVRAFVAMAFFTGFLVSLLELACTGQVYLPTIMFVMSVPELAGQALLYLVLYCVMFILPLIVVFVLSYLGTTSDQLGAFINRHTAAIKLATALLFVALAFWMTYTVAPLFGLAPPWNWVAMAGVLVVIGLGVLVLQLRDQTASEKRVSRRRRSRA
jgi:cytochrome c biogenesis protein CcdA/thiol-disulfide isomerase/thioredoxin